VAIIRMRRLMLDAARALDAGATPPPGLAEPVPYNDLRAIERMLPRETDWRDLFATAPA
jgi:phthalate 4,5-dioxygenase oxygenase subunit